MASNGTNRGQGFIPQEIIRRVRDGIALSEAEVRFFVEALHDERLSEGQVAAFAMAVFFRGLTRDECVALTLAMKESGTVLDWSSHDLPGPVVDKHSTGGVGDKVSLILAPMLAACGAVVPMISGRGLGHTGGTLDKLESIPGYDVRPSDERFGEVLKEVGCAVIGQTASLAPADKRFYAIRDVTATVESIPLITASILSKKLAAGLQRLVLDVKVGSGAFIPEPDRARDLAHSLVEVANGAGLPCSALLTDMDQVLGLTAGHANEVLESIDHLTGKHREPRLHEVTVALAAELLQHTGLAEDAEAARARAQQVLDDGSAAERFAAMVKALGGPADLLQRPEHHLPLGSVERPVCPTRRGYLAKMNVRAVGLSLLAMGGGRRRTEDAIDPGVGLSRMQSLGTELGPEAPLCVVHARDEAQAEACARALLQAIELSDEAPAPRPVLHGRVAADPMTRGPEGQRTQR
ncbi:thymidine phosphorylase [Paraliomyxa miuraensis]|uniref:thymidine phosphorylase n=1 Tax=Paraliomyxa miuraensis TaxID=376150 RepID=UPI0022575493|nr:thymidine phosphorylase [Paraliomyxa miuraensis]MCX4245258.1 thymidine phosphorylase [Paraliomyxa miuraensis]